MNHQEEKSVELRLQAMTEIVRLSFCVATDTIVLALAHRSVVALTLLEVPANLLVSLNKERKRFLWTHIHNLFKTQDATFTRTLALTLLASIALASCCSGLPGFSAEQRILNQKAPEVPASVATAGEPFDEGASAETWSAASLT